MFIRLTRIDGLPIWINASFVVTVEPTRSGGSIVVPIGDGLDYDVREAPESVLALLNEAPPARVVPVPPPKALTKTPDDVSPDTGYRRGENEDGETDTANGKPLSVPSEEPKQEESKLAPKKRTRKTTKKTVAKKNATSAAESAEKEMKEEAKVVPAVVEKPEPADFDKIVAGLKVHKCRTERRLRNAIKGFFGKTDEAEIDHIIETMINRNLIQVGADGHIDWAT